MIKRIIFGILLGCFGVGVLVVGMVPRLIIIALLMLMANHEMLFALQEVGHKTIKWPGYAFAILICPVYYFFEAEGALSLVVAVVIGAFCQRVFSKNLTTKDVLFSLLVLIYPTAPFLLVFMSAFLPSPLWQTILLLGIAIACLTDTFALFTGLLFGKHKLSPQISPNKTIEGSIGGLVFGILTSILAWRVQFLWHANYSMLLYLIAGVLCSLAGQIGDLTASSIKRETGIKDFGKLIPGHGGVLDRLDSILFAIPVAYVIFRFS